MSYLKTDKLQLDIIINGDESRKELMKLEGDGKKLRAELKKMTEGTEDYIKKSNELKSVEARMEAIRKEIGLTGSTMKELRQRQRELNAALSNIDPRLPVYRELRTELNQVNARMGELRGNAQTTGLSLGKMADGFNRYMGMFAAATASLTGVVLGIKAAKKASDEYEQSLQNLSALTGLEGMDLSWLGEQAKKMGTETQEGGIKITKGATDILRAYTLMGSAKPELLKDKEALNEVTKQALILAEAAQMETEPAVTALASIMNQFGAGADQAGKYINVLAAGAKEGAAEIPDLGDSIIKFGAAAGAANIPVEQSVALVEALSEKGIKGEIAGTGLKTMLIKLMSGADDTNPKIVGLNTALDNLAAKNMSAAEMTKLFGLESYTVAQNIINQKNRVGELTTAVTGTNTAYEQAAKTTSSAKAAMEQAKNRLNLMAIELGEKLTPALTLATGWTTKFMGATINALQFIKENQNLIIGLIGATIALNAAKIKSVGSMVLEQLTMKTGMGLRIKDAVLLEVAIIKEELHAAMIGKTTIMQKAAAVATIAWQRALSLLGGPIGLIIAGITAVATALIIYNNRTNEATRLKKLMLDVETAGIQNSAEQRIEMEMLLKVARDEKKSKEDRLAAIKKLNEISPEYLGNLSLENINSKEATKSADDYTKALIKQAEAKASLEKITEIQKQIDALQTGAESEGAGFWQNVGNFISSGGNATAASVKNAVSSFKNTQEKIKELNSQKEALSDKFTKEQTAKTITALKDEAGAIATGNDLKLELEKKSIKELQEIKRQSNDKNQKELINQILADRKENEKGKKEDLNLEKEYQQMKIDMMKDGWQKELAKEEENHRLNLEQYKGNNKLLELENERHAKTMDLVKTQRNQENTINKLVPKGVKENKLADFQENPEFKQKMLLAEYENKLYLDSADFQRSTLKQKLRDNEISEREYKEKIKALDIAERSNKLQIYSQIFGTMQGALKEGSIAYKAMAVAQATIATYQGAAAAVALPPIGAGPLLGPILAGVTIAAGLANVAKIVGIEMATGNVDVIGAQSGKRYNARRGGRASGVSLVKSPTMMQSENGADFLMGEQMPELIIDGPRTRNMMLNYPEIFNAIRSIPQFAAGNVSTKEIRTESKMFTDPELKDLMRSISDKLNGVDLLTLSNKLGKVDTNKKNINDKFNTTVE